MECQYVIPWYGECKKETINGTSYCKEHTLLCVVCHDVATNGCSCAGSWVCDAPLCNNPRCAELHWRKH